jgi:hypothetical protein
METIDNLLKIGTRVGNSTVMQIVCGLYHDKMNKGIRPMWDKYYPSWRHFPVYYVLLDKPQKQCSLEQFRESCPYIKEEYLEQEYAKVPESTILAIPEEAALEQIKSSEAEKTDE